MYSFIITKRDRKRKTKTYVTWAEDYIFDPFKETFTTRDEYQNILRIYDLASGEILRIDVYNASNPQEDILQTYLGRY